MKHLLLCALFLSWNATMWTATDSARDPRIEEYIKRLLEMAEQNLCLAKPTLETIREINKQRMHELEANIAQTREEITELTREINTVKTTVTETCKTSTELTSELNTMEFTYSAIRFEVQKLLNQLDTQNAKLQQTIATLNNTKERIKVVQAQVLTETQAATTPPVKQFVLGLIPGSALAGLIAVLTVRK